MVNGSNMEPDNQSVTNVTFGRFRVMRRRRELLADGRPVKLSGRAFDVLVALTENPGTVISKDTLMMRVWPDRIVEENALQTQISVLRRALGAERNLVRTIPGRGYQFASEVQMDVAEPVEPSRTSITTPPAEEGLRLHSIPRSLSKLIGREDKLNEVLRAASTHRLITLTGTAGIGKTRLALAAAERLIFEFRDGIAVVDLAAVTDQNLVPAAVAAATGCELIGGAISANEVGNALNGRTLLLILDNCEHVIGGAAETAEALLLANPAIHIIATSRERLRAEGERLLSVPPLSVPKEGADPGNDPYRYGAMHLFLERSRAAGVDFQRTSDLMRTTAAVCRRLDGIPLAIELTAARAAALGIEAVAIDLSDRSEMPPSRRRTASTRHQTLRAALDWSYELLSLEESIVFRRLAVFPATFSLAAAEHVAMGAGIQPSMAVNVLSNLLGKSLVVKETHGNIERFRMLETTRAYALKKLRHYGEHRETARLHALYYRDFFKDIETELQHRSTTDWVSDYHHEIHNLNAAISWAYSEDGDVSCGPGPASQTT